jgi:ubiquinone/menaquinone biosynthesis C-methylase UbiE
MHYIAYERHAHCLKLKGAILSLKKMYDTIASNYNTADMFGSISKSHAVALLQIKALLENMNDKPWCVTDLGVGDGHFLSQLKGLINNAHMTGIDISKEMLLKAALRLPLTTIQAKANEASYYLPLHNQDLVLAHFINAYVPIDELLKTANYLTKSNGYFSFITTTYESFPASQKALADFIAKDTLIARLIGHYCKTVANNTTVASNLEELNLSFHRHDFNIVSHERIHVPIYLKSIHELIQFGIDGTWFLNAVSVKMLPKNFLISRLKKICPHIVTFPHQDTHIIDIILAKK